MPNEVVDVLMTGIRPAEFNVLMYLVRRISGFDRDSDTMSLLISLHVASSHATENDWNTGPGWVLRQSKDSCRHSKTMASSSVNNNQDPAADMLTPSITSGCYLRAVRLVSFSRKFFRPPRTNHTQWPNGVWSSDEPWAGCGPWA